MNTIVEDRLALADWRQQMATLYADVRRAHDPRMGWREFCLRRDHLFREHPQTPLTHAQRETFHELPYYPYSLDWRVRGTVETAVSPQTYELTLPREGLFRFTEIGTVHFELFHREASLALYWIEGYGGGLFLPFRDASNGRTTYGGGRYLYDSIKGADLHRDRESLLMDFNFAYNPSCAYNDAWVCPLAPPPNRLSFAVEAGEQAFSLAD